MSDCKVSVCIPTYNYAAFLPEAIESVLAQRCTDFELLIIDDNSSDDTRSVVERYVRQDSRIRFSVNPVNVGMVQNWNLCLAQARGEYIKFIFGDDLLASPDALGRMAAVLDADSSVSLVCSARNIVDENSRLQQVKSHFKTGTVPGVEVINQCLAWKRNLVGEPSVVMFRKEHAARGFSASYRQIVDLEMWFYLLEQGSFAYIDEPLCSFRVHSRQETNKTKENDVRLQDDLNLVQEYLDKEYVTVSGFLKRYIRCDNAYAVWKLYRNKKLTKDQARRLIGTHHGYASFRFLLPFYKLFKPCFKLYRRCIL